MRMVLGKVNDVVTCAVALGLLVWASGLTGTCAAQPAVPEQQSPEEIAEQLSGDQQPEADAQPAVAQSSAEEDDQAAEFLRWQRAEQDWQLPEEMRLENLRRFGEELFAGTGGEEPRTLNMPISPQYALGPGDELTVRTWSEGIEHLNTTVLVSAEGTIYLPLAGEVEVAGQSLGAARDMITAKLSQFYIDSQTTVTISEPRMVTVYLTGDVARPGRYGLNGTATVLTALYMGGGPSEAGSLRDIRLVKPRQAPVRIDLYPYLLKGEPLDDPPLENGDTIFVGRIGDEIGVTGEVRRPRRYEIAGPITCRQAIELAGGPSPAGSLRDVTVWRIVNHRRQEVLSLDLTQSGDSTGSSGSELTLQAGDVVVVEAIDKMPENAVRISGAVRRAGVYEVAPQMTVGDLISLAGGLAEGAYLGYGEVRRLDEYSQHHYESFSVRNALDAPVDSLALAPYDAVRIFYRYEATPITYVEVVGPVQNPGQYQWSADMRVKDLVMQSGGVTEQAYLEQATLLCLQPDGQRRMVRINLQEALADDSSSNIELQAGDILRVTSRRPPDKVHIAGFVREAGDYDCFEGMNVSDLILAAQGVAPGASDTIEYARGWQSGPATVYRLKLRIRGDGQISVEPDIVLGSDDMVTVLGRGDFKQQPAVVHVSGQVENPGTYVLRGSADEQETVYDLLQRAGPLLDNADPNGVVVYRPSERALAKGQRQNLELIVAMYNRESASSMVQGETEARRTVLAEQVSANVGQLFASGGGTALMVPPRHLSLSAWVSGIPVEGSKLLETHGEEADVLVQDGDTIVVPEIHNTLAVLGAVIRPGKVPYRQGANIDFYIDMVGGPADDAAVGRAVVVRANGAARRRSQIKEIRPGDVIIVPSDYMVRTVLTDSTFQRILKTLGSLVATFLVFN